MAASGQTLEIVVANVIDFFLPVETNLPGSAFIFRTAPGRDAAI
jgi:hypothetical protein